MRKRNYKGRCEKRVLKKCKSVLKTYDPIQSAYADVLEKNEEVTEIRCNVPLDNLEIGEYMSDFVCTKTDGDLMVCECVSRRLLLKPMTIKLLDASREFWLCRNVKDWRLVIGNETTKE